MLTHVPVAEEVLNGPTESRSINPKPGQVTRSNQRVLNRGAHVIRQHSEGGVAPEEPDDLHNPRHGRVRQRVPLCDEPQPRVKLTLILRPQHLPQVRHHLRVFKDALDGRQHLPVCNVLKGLVHLRGDVIQVKVDRPTKGGAGDGIRGGREARPPDAPPASSLPAHSAAA